MHCQPGKTESSAGGFTLIEMLVVLLILAIAAVMVIPYAVGTAGFQAIAAARMLAADLQYAQNTAITSQAPITITFDVSGESYTLSNASGPLIHPMTKADYVVNFASQGEFGELDIVSASFASMAAVTFDILGAPDNEGTVILQAGNHVYRVTVSAAIGKVTVTTEGP